MPSWVNCQDHGANFKVMKLSFKQTADSEGCMDLPIAFLTANNKSLRGAQCIINKQRLPIISGSGSHHCRWIKVLLGLECGVTGVSQLISVMWTGNFTGVDLFTPHFLKRAYQMLIVYQHELY